MSHYRLDDLYIDLDHRTVSRNGARLDVSGLNFDVLIALVEGATKPLSVSALARQAWRLDHVSEETVAKRIALLREALGDDARQPRYVRTVRGHGYALAAPVETVARRERTGLRWRWVLPGVPAVAGVLAIFSLAALPAQADYALIAVDGETGAVQHSMVREAAGLDPLQLVDPDTGDVLLRRVSDGREADLHAASLLALAEARHALGETETAAAYARAAIELNPARAEDAREFLQ